MANTRPCLPSTGVFLRQWSALPPKPCTSTIAGPASPATVYRIRWPSPPRTSPPRRRRGDARRARREGTRRRPRRPRRRRGRAEGQARACHGRSASRRRCRARRRPRVCRRRGGRAPRRARGGRGGGEGHRGRCLSARAREVGPRSGVRGCLEWRRNNVSPVSPVRPRGLRIRAETSPPETLESLGQPEPVRSLLGVGGALVLSRKSFLPPPRLQTCARHRVAH